MKKVLNIKWDTDGDMEVLNDLPKEIVIPDHIKNEEISDYISDKTGFCHAGYDLVYIVTKEEILAMIESKNLTYQWVGMDKDDSNADNPNATYFVALCQTKWFVEKTFPVYIPCKRAYADMDEEIAGKIEALFKKGRIHVDEEEIEENFDSSFEVRRKVLFTWGMTHDQMLIITDAPKEDIENWCRRYKLQQENGGGYELFDTLKTKYYVKELLDSEIDDEESFEVLGFDEAYDFSDYDTEDDDIETPYPFLQTLEEFSLLQQLVPEMLDSLEKEMAWYDTASEEEIGECGEKLSRFLVAVHGSGETVTDWLIDICGRDKFPVPGDYLKIIIEGNTIPSTGDVSNGAVVTKFPKGTITFAEVVAIAKENGFKHNNCFTLIAESAREGKVYRYEELEGEKPMWYEVGTTMGYA